MLNMSNCHFFNNMIVLTCILQLCRKLLIQMQHDLNFTLKMNKSCCFLYKGQLLIQCYWQSLWIQILSSIQPHACTLKQFNFIFSIAALTAMLKNAPDTSKNIFTRETVWNLTKKQSKIRTRHMIQIYVLLCAHAVSQVSGHTARCTENSRGGEGWLRCMFLEDCSSREQVHQTES